MLVSKLLLDFHERFPLILLFALLNGYLTTTVSQHPWMNHGVVAPICWHGSWHP